VVSSASAQVETTTKASCNTLIWVGGGLGVFSVSSYESASFSMEESSRDDLRAGSAVGETMPGRKSAWVWVWVWVWMTDVYLTDACVWLESLNVPLVEPDRYLP